MIVGVEQGTYTVNGGTRQFTVYDLDFTPTKEGVLVILNITQNKIVYAAAQSFTKELIITEGEESISQVHYVFEYASTLPELVSGDELHIQLQSSNVANVIPVNGYNGIVAVAPGHVSTKNSTIETLLAGISFTGEWEDITNFGVIVISLKSDINSATDGLVVQFSSDRTVDGIISDDEFFYMGGAKKTFSFQAAAQYFRVVYTNGDSDQTSFNLQTILKPYYVKPSSHRISDAIVDDDDAELVKAVLTGVDPDDMFVNIGASYGGGLKTALIDGETGSRAEIEPLGALKTSSPVRLVGTTFSNGTKDTNFWTETNTNSGSITQAGQITLSTGTTADSTARYETVRKARKITGTTNQFRCIAGLTTDAQLNNIRRIGAYSHGGDGFFFQSNGVTMQVVSRKNAVDTAVSSGSFNGNYGITWIPVVNTLYRLTIDYTANGAKFFVDGALLHTIFNTVDSYSNTLTLPVTMENINSGGNTTDNTFVVQFATILRLGELVTNAISKYISTNTTTILKYNAGILQRIISLDSPGSITVYDNTAGSGTIIATIDASKVTGTLTFNAPFSNGLTVVTGLGAKITVIYE